MYLCVCLTAELLRVQDALDRMKIASHMGDALDMYTSTLDRNKSSLAAEDHDEADELVFPQSKDASRQRQHHRQAAEEYKDAENEGGEGFGDDGPSVVRRQRLESTSKGMAKPESTKYDDCSEDNSHKADACSASCSSFAGDELAAGGGAGSGHESEHAGSSSATRERVGMGRGLRMEEGRGGSGEEGDEWWTTGSKYLGMRAARFVHEDDEASSMVVGTIVSWLPVHVADYVSVVTGEVSSFEEGAPCQKHNLAHAL